MANSWFEETFLPSLETRMNNPKYPNQVILTKKQEEVCRKYMNRVSFFSNALCREASRYEYKIGDATYKLQYIIGGNTILKKEVE